jgi:acetoin utilization deacetylase AcuC-like enzyme
MRAPPIVHHPDYSAPLPNGHRFPMGKFAALAAILRAENLAPDGFAHPEPADRAALIMAHDQAYVDAVLACAVPRATERRIGLPITPDVVRRACAAPAGTLLAARLALSHGVACNTAGGSHHAFRETGAGFCVFNDVAVAALTLLHEGAIARALVVDCDVHQGDGTAAIFADDARVFTLSVHCEQNFPARKQISDCDVGLPRATDGEAYLAALARALDQAFARIRPDIVFYNAGVDVHADDGLGYLALSDADIAARDRLVMGEARRRCVPVCGVLGGGYGPDPTLIAARHASLFRTAAAMGSVTHS